MTIANRSHPAFPPQVGCDKLKEKSVIQGESSYKDDGDDDDDSDDGDETQGGNQGDHGGNNDDQGGNGNNQGGNGDNQGNNGKGDQGGDQGGNDGESSEQPDSQTKGEHVINPKSAMVVHRWARTEQEQAEAYQRHLDEYLDYVKFRHMDINEGFTADETEDQSCSGFEDSDYVVKEEE